MQIGEIVGVVFAALVLTLPLIALHNVYEIGSAQLPAPQAGLMALMAQGIVNQEMAWGLVIAGMFLAVGLILVKAPAPMLIAVGMYLPFESTSAIFVGGLVKWIFELSLKRKGATEDERGRAENTGVLVSSGFIAGESLMAVALALLVMAVGQPELQAFFAGLAPLAQPSFFLSALAYVIVLWMLVRIPVSRMKEGGLPSTHLDH
jgi:uncharacterized oligopeptide transporter (OPT) family protein